MKQILLTSALLCLFFSASAQFKAGVGAAVQFNGSSFGVTGKGHYTINENFAGQTSFTYYFDDFTDWSLDLDVHYVGLELSVVGFAISPFAGLNIFRFGNGIFGASASTTNINIGVNATKEIGSLELFIEPKFTIGNGSSLNIAAGVYF